MLDTKYQNFMMKLKKNQKRENFTDKLHTFAYGTDASFYRLIPKIVIKLIMQKRFKILLNYLILWI